MYMPNTMTSSALQKEPFSWKKSAPAIAVIAFHLALIYGLAATLGYVRIPFAPPNSTVVTVPTEPVQTKPDEPIKLDQSLAKPEIVKPEMPVVVLDQDTPETPAAETAPVVTQPMTSESSNPPPTVGVRLLNHPEPPYPAVSRQQGEEGTAMIRVTINAQGKVADVALATSSGYPRLDEAAMKAVRTWRFAPSTQGATAMTTTVVVPVKFQLNLR